MSKRSELPDWIGGHHQALRQIVYLSPAQEAEMLAAARAGDAKARATLIRSYLPLASRRAWRFHRTTGLPYEDLLQEAYLGVCQVADATGYEVGPFGIGGLVRKYVARRLYHHLEDLRLLRRPLWLRYVRRTVYLETKRLSSSLGRAPSREEVIEAAGIKPEHYDALRPEEVRSFELDPEELLLWLDKLGHYDVHCPLEAQAARQIESQVEALLPGLALSEILLCLRETLGMSRTALARLAQLSTNALTRIECGREPWGATVARLVATLVDVFEEQEGALADDFKARLDRRRAEAAPTVATPQTRDLLRPEQVQELCRRYNEDRVPRQHLALEYRIKPGTVSKLVHGERRLSVSIGEAITNRSRSSQTGGKNHPQHDEALRLMQQIGVTAAAKKLGLTESMVQAWRRQAIKDGALRADAVPRSQRGSKYPDRKNCEVCGTEYTPPRGPSRTCSWGCRNKLLSSLRLAAP